jgi:hypothetical protein
VPVAFHTVSTSLAAMTRTKSSTIFTIFVALLSILLVRAVLEPAIPPPVPDLIKLTELAKNFEPLIVYSENGHNQIVALQETSVAVWDLGESVRYSNIVSAPLIVKELDSLSDALGALGLELTRFFADVDGDVDAILIVMDWARRELSGVDTGVGSSMAGRTFDHIHGLLDKIGLVEKPSGPTALGNALTTIFGATSPQRTRVALTRTFYEFLGVLEESINTEITHSANLFAIFEAIDRQFSIFALIQHKRIYLHRFMIILHFTLFAYTSRVSKKSIITLSLTHDNTTHQTKHKNPFTAHSLPSIYVHYLLYRKPKKISISGRYRARTCDFGVFHIWNHTHLEVMILEVLAPHSNQLS